MLHQSQQNGQPVMTPDDVWNTINDPLLRWEEVPGGKLLAQQLMVDPADGYLRELFDLRVQEQITKANQKRDPFHASYPSKGSLPALRPGRVPLANLPTGDVLSLQVDDLCRNLLLVGPAGGGKTNSLRVILSYLLHACKKRKTTVIAFNPKGDLIDCETLCQEGLPVLVLDWTELKIALLHRPSRIRLTDFVNSTVEFLAAQTGLIASRRLMMTTLHNLLRRHRLLNTTPTLSEWVEKIDRITASGLSRLGYYREGVLFALNQILYSFGSVIDYAESTMIEQICNFNGLVVIQTDGLDPDNASFLAGLFAKHAYDSRASYLDDGDVEHHPILFCLDDAMRLVQTRMSDGGEQLIDPISAWVLLARSRKIGFIVAAQNFSSISPTLTNNTANVVCCSSFGRDAEELARYLNLDKDQAAMLPVLQPGEVIAIARSIHPLAVYGRVPYVK